MLRLKNKIVLKILIVLCLISVVGCSVSKKVKTKEFDIFKKEISHSDKIKDVQIEFRRPALFINLTTTKDFKKEDLKVVLDQLKPVINPEHMGKIADKYWVKDTKISTVYVSFYDGKIDNNDSRKNLTYSLYTDYYKTHVVDDDPDNIDGYKTWYIEIDQKEY